MKQPVQEASPGKRKSPSLVFPASQAVRAEPGDLKDVPRDLVPSPRPDMGEQGQKAAARELCDAAASRANNEVGVAEACAVGLAVPSGVDPADHSELLEELEGTVDRHQPETRMGRPAQPADLLGGETFPVVCEDLQNGLSWKCEPYAERLESFNPGLVTGNFFHLLWIAKQWKLVNEEMAQPRNHHQGHNKGLFLSHLPITILDRL